MSESPLISHLRSVGYHDDVDASSPAMIGSTVDAKVFQVSDLQRGRGDLLSRVQSRTVLIKDQKDTIAFEPYPTWHFQHAVLSLLSMVAQSKGRAPASATEFADALFDTPPRGRSSQAALSILGETLRLRNLARMRGLRQKKKPTPLHTVNASALQEYRPILNRAKTEPVVVCKHDKPLGVLELSETRSHEAELARHLDDVVQFLAAYRQLSSEEPAAWLLMTPYPWMASVTRDVLADFADELFPYLLRAVRENDPSVFERNLRAWRSVGKTWDDERVRKGLAVDPATVPASVDDAPSP